MLSSSQKRVLEWPLLIFGLMFTQIMELTFNRVSVAGVSLHFVPIVITYVALTRNWGKLFVVALTLAYIGSAVVAYPMAIYLSVQLWTALGVKATVYAFALEGRRPFAALVMGASAIARLLTWMLLSQQGHGLPLGQLLLSLVLNVVLAGGLAWLCFPIFVAWDTFFEHEADDARDLDPNVLR